MAKGNGGIYPYFFCVGRHRRNGCDLPHLPIDEVEDQICRYYEKRVRLSAELVERIRTGLVDELHAHQQHDKDKVQRLERRITKLDQERRKWAEKVVVGSVPDDIGRAKQNELAAQLIRAQATLAKLRLASGDIEAGLNKALDLIPKCGQAYRQARPDLRRDWNQALFLRIEVDIDRLTEVELAPPFDSLLDQDLVTYYRQSAQAIPVGRTAIKKTGAALGVGLNKGLLVEMWGVEPQASAMRMRRSTN